MYPFTIGGIFSPMKFQDCPEILSLSGSFKEGKDEYYHRLDFCSLIMLDGFCRFESEDYVRDIIPGDILIVPAGQSRIYRHPPLPEMPSRPFYYCQAAGKDSFPQKRGGFPVLCRRIRPDKSDGAQKPGESHRPFLGNCFIGSKIALRGRVLRETLSHPALAGSCSPFGVQFSPAR